MRQATNSLIEFPATLKRMGVQAIVDTMPEFIAERWGYPERCIQQNVCGPFPDTCNE